MSDERKLPRVNSLLALTRLRPKRGSEFSTFAFVLNRDMIKPDGSLDELHAVIFPLGSFDEEKKAEEHAKNIISITGHHGVIVAAYGMPVPLTVNFDPKNIVEVPVDTRSRLLDLESSQYERENKEHERHLKLEEDIEKEAQEESDPNSIEHFKRQCYLAVKNRATYEFHMHEAQVALDNYKKREATVREHHLRHPEHEKQWLPFLKKKLLEREEGTLYTRIENGYNKIRDELLGSGQQSKCEGGVCFREGPVEASLISESSSGSEDVEIITVADLLASAGR